MCTALWRERDAPSSSAVLTSYSSTCAGVGNARGGLSGAALRAAVSTRRPALHDERTNSDSSGNVVCTLRRPLLTIAVEVPPARSMIAARRVRRSAL